MTKDEGAKITKASSAILYLFEIRWTLRSSVNSKIARKWAVKNWSPTTMNWMVLNRVANPLVETTKFSGLGATTNFSILVVKWLSTQKH